MAERKWFQPLLSRSIHVVSQIHALIIVPLALRALESPELDQDRAFGIDRSSSIVAAVAYVFILLSNAMLTSFAGAHTSSGTLWMRSSIL